MHLYKLQLVSGNTHASSCEVEMERDHLPPPTRSGEREMEGDVLAVPRTRSAGEEMQAGDPAHLPTRSNEAQVQREDPIDLGDYEVICSRPNRLGTGGFGRVYKGRNTITNNDIAVKVIEISDKTRGYIKRENDLLRECHHENIIQLFHSATKSSTAYIVMEYCRQGNLNKFVNTNSINFEQCISFIVNVAAAIKYLHMVLLICHRDIKPDNILVSDANICKVADFGLAREFTGSTSFVTGSAVGTHSWLPPEVITDNNRIKYNLSVDIFPLGLLFLSMIRLLPNTGDLDAFKGECYFSTDV